MKDIIVRLIDMPTTVRGFTARDNNEDYNIYLNSKLAKEILYRTYEHEKKHILREDFDSEESVYKIERDVG